MTPSPDPRARAQAAWKAWDVWEVPLVDFMLAFAESERKIAAEAAGYGELRAHAVAVKRRGYCLIKSETFLNNWFDKFSADVFLALLDSLAAKDTEIAGLREAADATLEDERAAHQDTLRLLGVRDAELATLRTRVEELTETADEVACRCVERGERCRDDGREHLCARNALRTVLAKGANT